MKSTVVNLTVDTIEWRFDDYLHFKKCGEITASPDEKCFGLNCVFCHTICLQLDTFMEHIREQHSRELWALYFSTDDVVGGEELIGADEDMETHQQQQQQQQQHKQHMELNETNFNNNNKCFLTGPLLPPSSTLPSPPLTPPSQPPEAEAAPTTHLAMESTELQMQKEVEKIALTLAEVHPREAELEADDDDDDDGDHSTDNRQTTTTLLLPNNDELQTDLQDFLNFEGLIDDGTSPEEETSSQHSSSQESCIHESESKHSREVLTYILEAFKSHEMLWNPNHPEYKYNSKKQLYDTEISPKLRSDLGYDMTGDEIAEEIKKLRNMYRNDLTKMHTRKGLYIPRLWCFEQMEFLRQPMQMARRLGRWKRTNSTDRETESENDEFRRGVLSADVTLKIIEIYKEHPCLWFVDHPDFRSNTYRKEALHTMLKHINEELRLNFTLDQLEKLLKNLRRNYSIEKREQMRKDDGQSKPSFQFYEQLSTFLDSNIGPFRCIHCDLIVNTSDQYKVHRSTHDGTSPFVCSICNKGFASAGNMSIHLRRHRGDLPFECKECGKRVATTTELAIHMRSHTGEKPYVCDQCGKTFKSWSFFNIHKRIHRNQPSFVCSVCSKGFYEKGKFTDHMNSHLNIRNKVCKVCAKTFTCHSNLKKHMELHEERKKYKCTICNRAYAQLAGLRAHMTYKHAQVMTRNLRTRKQLI